VYWARSAVYSNIKHTSVIATSEDTSEKHPRVSRQTRCLGFGMVVNSCKMNQQIMTLGVEGDMQLSTNHTTYPSPLPPV
jgi:hypothetical protein